METIKNYLNSMFRNLPETKKVLRAKSELFQMMEDKYTELIENGISENEAVGTVISEFGNLDELADDLGIAEEISIKNTIKEQSRKVSSKEINDFLIWKSKVPVYRGLGIAFCICSVIPPILIDDTIISDVLGPVLMFIMIAIGVCLIVFSGKGSQEWKFLYHTKCNIDKQTYNSVIKRKHDFMKKYSMFTSSAIGCYILCCVPLIIFDYFNSDFLNNLGTALLFVLVATGVFLNVYSGTIESSLNFVLGLNDRAKYFTSPYTADADKKNSYINVWNDKKEEKDNKQINHPRLREVMSVFWFTITCLYLIFSFLTFRWHITWVIWPVAAIAWIMLNNIAAK